MCSCLSSAPQPRQRGTEGSTWQSIGQGPQGPGLYSGMALLGDNTKSHCLSAAEESTPVPSAPGDNAGWGIGTGIAHRPPTWMQSCLPPALWEEMLVLSQRNSQNRVTCCSTFSMCGKDIRHVEMPDSSRGLWQ